MMDKELETQAHFLIESGNRKSERLVEDCFTGLCRLLHKQWVQVDGKMHQIKVIGSGTRITFDIMDLPGFDHVEFTVTKTGWGHAVNQTSGE